MCGNGVYYVRVVQSGCFVGAGEMLYLMIYVAGLLCELICRPFVLFPGGIERTVTRGRENGCLA